MFSREYSKFIVDLLEQLPQEGRNELLQLAITSYLTVSLRDKSDLAMYS